MAWDVREPDARVVTSPGMKIASAQTSGENLDQNIAVARLRASDVNDAGYSPEGLVQNGTHQPSIPQPRGPGLHCAGTAREPTCGRLPESQHPLSLSFVDSGAGAS
jgi:hypothetical protein